MACSVACMQTGMQSAQEGDDRDASWQRRCTDACNVGVALPPRDASSKLARYTLPPVGQNRAHILLRTHSTENTFSGTTDTLVGQMEECDEDGLDQRRRRV